MFQSDELDNHLKTSDTIKTESLVYSEWNLNDPQNIQLLGNYRYRPGTSDNQFSTLPVTFDPSDFGNYYTGATDSDISVISGFDDDDQPTLFTTTKEKMKLLYSLEDCLKNDRPRSGINKILYLGDSANQYFDIGDKNLETQDVLNIARRPRYYMSSRDDQFKYWTSYRTATGTEGAEAGIQLLREYGISKQPNQNGISYIDDAVPFVVYKENVPANRIVIKMQTNVGDIDLGPFRRDDQVFLDPLYGQENQTTPQRWAVQVLKGNEWVEVISFDENSVDKNNEPIIKSDGYVEIAYGLVVPDFYRNDMIVVGELSDTSLLPETAIYGYTFLVKESDQDLGTLYFYEGSTWIAITPEYRWFFYNEDVSINTPLVSQLSNPKYFIDQGFETIYREFDLIRGMRIVVKTMNRPECTFDLIEMSPRLVANITDKVSSFSITKEISDLGNGSLPIGGIFASTGSITIFDDDFSFNHNNEFDEQTKQGSIVSKYIDMRTKFIFYNLIKNVEGFDYYIPIKTMYSDKIPSISGQTATATFNLRDKFYFLESNPAPELLITDTSISYAVTLLLDYIGFSNYVFKRIDGIPEITIPYFFVAPDQNVAEVLEQLAVASQTAMFFDEYNNFVVMSKEYLMPENNQRQTDTFLYGQQEGNNLPNIVNLSSEEKRVFNQGRIDYTTRYIQRQISKYSQANYIDKYKTYGYKPSLLWEVSGRENLKSINESISESQGFSLTAMPLNSDLTADVPRVVNQQIINNVMDFSDGVEWITAYNGYLYANGEIIKFDAVEYSYTGPLNGEENIVWIKNNDDYQRYFSRLPFNGKMYPTGNVRIFAEPEFEIINGETKLKEGSVKKHGRGQFGTPITSHQAGLDPYWSNNNNVRGCLQQGKDYLFNTSEIINYPENLTNNVAGKINQTISGISRFTSDEEAKKSSRSGLIKNFRVNKYFTEKESNYFDTARAGTLQSSALVFQGPALPEQVRKSDFVSYVYKNLPQPYKHFGTRMRIIGKIRSGGDSSQEPFGAFELFSTQDINADDPEKNIQILGGSGGIAFGLNEQTNNGYYFEIVSLTQDNIEQYNGAIKENQVNYTILPTPAASCVDNVVTISLAQNVLDPGDDLVRIPTPPNPDGTPGTRTPITRPIPKIINNVLGEKLNLQVGETVTISGLVDSLDPNDTETPLNGEYEIISINEDGKSLQYRIPGSSIPNRTSNTGGTLVKSLTGQNVVSNIYFYKVLADSKTNRFVSYSITNNVLKINLRDDVTYVPGEKILIDHPPTTAARTIAGEAIVSGVSGKSITINVDRPNLETISFGGVTKLVDPLAIPYKLWSGVADIIVDDGKFTGQYRFAGEENPTVYDLAAEYVNIGASRRFYLYLNNKQIATVDDVDPLPEYNNIALFVRGSSKCMFENIYAVGANLSQNSRVVVAQPVSKIWGDQEIDASEALRKYSISGVIQKTYLSGIGSGQPPSHILYFDEFGTIMREVAYFNIKYDRSFPALYSKIMKTFNRLQGYVVSGYYGSSYGADFLIFNTTDKILNLSDTTGNFLRIQGITFTQNTTKTLTVDDYYQKVSNFSDPIINFDSTLVNPLAQLEEYNVILNSRNRYGINDFSLSSEYIQTQEAAENILGWTIKKISSPKIVVGINTFATQNIQLGDIVQIDYKNNEGIKVVSDKDKRFVVYNIEYEKSLSEENITMYLVEV